MKLISCDDCGTVFDQDKVPFPSNIHDEEGYIDERKGRYNQKTKSFEAFIECPVMQKL